MTALLPTTDISKTFDVYVTPIDNAPNKTTWPVCLAGFVSVGVTWDSSSQQGTLTIECKEEPIRPTLSYRSDGTDIRQLDRAIPYMWQTMSKLSARVRFGNGGGTYTTGPLSTIAVPGGGTAGGSFSATFKTSDGPEVKSIASVELFVPDTVADPGDWCNYQKTKLFTPALSGIPSKQVFNYTDIASFDGMGGSYGALKDFISSTIAWYCKNTAWKAQNGSVFLYGSSITPVPPPPPPPDVPVYPSGGSDDAGLTLLSTYDGGINTIDGWPANSIWPANLMLAALGEFGNRYASINIVNSNIVASQLPVVDYSKRASTVKFNNPPGVFTSQDTAPQPTTVSVKVPLAKSSSTADAYTDAVVDVRSLGLDPDQLAKIQSQKTPWIVLSVLYYKNPVPDAQPYPMPNVKNFYMQITGVNTDPISGGGTTGGGVPIGNQGTDGTDDESKIEGDTFANIAQDPEITLLLGNGASAASAQLPMFIKSKLDAVRNPTNPVSQRSVITKIIAILISMQCWDFLDIVFGTWSVATNSNATWTSWLWNKVKQSMSNPNAVGLNMAVSFISFLQGIANYFSGSAGTIKLSNLTDSKGGQVPDIIVDVNNANGDWEKFKIVYAARFSLGADWANLNKALKNGHGATNDLRLMMELIRESGMFCKDPNGSIAYGIRAPSAANSASYVPLDFKSLYATNVLNGIWTRLLDFAATAILTGLKAASIIPVDTYQPFKAANVVYQEAEKINSAKTNFPYIVPLGELASWESAEDRIRISSGLLPELHGIRVQDFSDPYGTGNAIFQPAVPGGVPNGQDGQAIQGVVQDQAAFPKGLLIVGNPTAPDPGSSQFALPAPKPDGPNGTYKLSSKIATAGASFPELQNAYVYNQESPLKEELDRLQKLADSRNMIKKNHNWQENQDSFKVDFDMVGAKPSPSFANYPQNYMDVRYSGDAMQLYQETRAEKLLEQRAMAQVAEQAEIKKLSGRSKPRTPAQIAQLQKVNEKNRMRRMKATQDVTLADRPDKFSKTATDPVPRYNYVAPIEDSTHVKMPKWLSGSNEDQWDPLEVERKAEAFLKRFGR
jgi:hypothetical protein